ncbi:MAG TPA: MFS transporter, partial [Terrimesophilobacter sp.]|nr:MFS transporter [Terrimesophilobacter sp.]
STLAMFAVLQLAVYGAMQIPVGLLLDRHGARPIMVIGMVLMVVGQLIMAFAPNVAVAIGARMLLGLGDAAIFPGVLRLIATWFPAQRAPIMVQATGIVGQLGQVIAVVPVVALLHLTSWVFTFGSFAALGVLFTILVWLVIRNHPPQLSQDVTVNTETGVINVVTSAIDTRVGLRAAWSHPGTRLAFWSHFATPFAGSAFIMLWGVPFLTAGQGQSPAAAASIVIVYIVAGMVFGPLIGTLSARIPMRRTRALVLPAVAVQAVAWSAVIAWPGASPTGVLVALAITMGLGGPASMIGFDHARTHNPSHRLSSATGITNVGGFLSSLLVIFFIGLALDLQGAGTPATYTLEAFKLAFLVQVPVWVLGVVMIGVERKNTRIVMGFDEPRPTRRPRTPRGVDEEAG